MNKVVLDSNLLIYTPNQSQPTNYEHILYDRGLLPDGFNFGLIVTHIELHSSHFYRVQMYGMYMQVTT